MTTALETRLNPRQEAFITNYLTNGGNASQAAKSAGYAPPYDKSGPRLLTHAGICRELERRQARLQSVAEYSVHDWRRELRAFIADAHAAGSHSAVFKGMELLGRHIGALNDRAALSGDELKAAVWLGAAMENMRLASSGQPVHQLAGPASQQASEPAK